MTYEEECIHATVMLNNVESVTIRTIPETDYQRVATVKMLNGCVAVGVLKEDAELRFTDLLSLTEPNTMEKQQ